MRSRTISLAALALFIGAGAFAADDGKKCTVSSHDCEQAIRQMLSGRRYLGAKLEEGNQGLIVKEIVENGPADRAELKPGDRLMTVNARSTAYASIRDFKQILGEAKGNGRLLMIVQRHGKLMKIEVRLEPYTKVQIDKIVAQHLVQSHTTASAAPQPQQ
jgi:C-terminal processing protease CtpA/Prc